MHSRPLPSVAVENEPHTQEHPRAARIRQKLENAMKLSGKIEVSL